MSELSRSNRAVFQIPDYRYYNISRFCWQLGLQMTMVATAWLVYERTKDPLALGFIGLATLTPAIPLSLVTGSIADRHDRRMIVMICCSLMALCAAAMLLLTSQSAVWPIYVVVVVIGAARAFSNPAGQALVMNIVPNALSSQGLAWTSSISQTATIVGPAVGGLLYPLGAGVPFGVALALFVTSVVAAGFIKTRTAPAHRPPVTVAMLLGGYHYIWKTPIILGTISLDLAVVLLGGATSLLPVFAHEVFHAGPWALGVLRSAPAVGSVLASVTIAHFPLRRRIGRTMFICVFVFGLATIGFGLSTNLYVAIFFLAILGAADVISVVIRQTFIQMETPSEMRGRVIAVHTITTNISNQLGDFESGVIAHFIGAVNAVVLGGIGSLIATLLWLKLFPTLRDRDTFERPVAVDAAAQVSRTPASV